MFLGRLDEARALYLKYRGQKDISDGKSWEAAILDDFADLGKSGLTNERDDPHELSDVALAVDCIMALLQEHCTRPLFSPSAPWTPCGRPSFTADKLRTRKELERIGARVLPKTHKKQ
jgi:hypothetical protein